MANNYILLGSLHFFAFSSCVFGLYYVHVNCSQVLSLLYTGLWFITSGLANFAGILSILFHYYDHEENLTWSNYCLQYHYLLAWISCIVGYTSFVTAIWMHYYPCVFAHIFIASSVIPLIAWIQRQGHLIIVTTQSVIVAAVAAHLYISDLAGNMYSLAGAFMMLVILLCVSLPTSYAVVGFSAREFCIISTTITSYLFAKAVEETSKSKPLKTLKPWGSGTEVLKIKSKSGSSCSLGEINISFILLLLIFLSFIKRLLVF